MASAGHASRLAATACGRRMLLRTTRRQACGQPSKRPARRDIGPDPESPPLTASVRNNSLPGSVCGAVDRGRRNSRPTGYRTHRRRRRRLSLRANEFAPTTQCRAFNLRRARLGARRFFMSSYRRLGSLTTTPRSLAGNRSEKPVYHWRMRAAGPASIAPLLCPP